MDDEKLTNLIVDKLCNRLGDALIKISVLCGVISFGLFVYGKTYYGEKSCNCILDEYKKSDTK